jgi:hypothetical protein
MKIVAKSLMATLVLTFASAAVFFAQSGDWLCCREAYANQILLACFDRFR